MKPLGAKSMARIIKAWRTIYEVAKDQWLKTNFGER